MATEFTPIAGLIGGVLIGAAAILLLLGCGRIAGNSGIFAGLLTVATPRAEATWRAAFIAGILAGAAVGALTGLYAAAELIFPPSLAVVAVAGLAVGIGTQLGSGCTSGHSVCGLARGSKRSLVATAVFMAVAIAVVFLMRHLV